MSSPISYWRQSQIQQPLLGQIGKLISFTQIEDNWIGIVKLKDHQITAPLIFNSEKPKVGDKVIAVLRILKKENNHDLIEYGIKFQLKSEI